MSMASTSNQIHSSSSSSSTPPPGWNVFLSFRGTDTRKTFTGHLYSALDRAGIRTFRDDSELPIGEEYLTQLLKAIQESKVSIVVFSENYAYSKLCLDELVKILECKQTMGQLVLPLFYDVDPWVVRHQTGSFAKAFERHEMRFGTNMEIVEKWKGALTEAANLSGYDLQNDANGDESELIPLIVKNVLSCVRPAELNINQSDSSRFPPLSSTLRWRVFLSFRGIDTRKKFTAHLNRALKQVGIRTFIDGPELPRGEEISSLLLKEIQESKVSIVVLSKNYACSRWCLDELVKILECRRTMGQLVLPVFYDVDPSDVRHKRGSFAEAFQSHRARFGTNMEIVEKWEGALTEVANISGCALRSHADGDESKLIQLIVNGVLSLLGPAELNISQSDSSYFPPLSSTPRWHVFLSFRGSDTRKKFTGHLVRALKQVGIQAYIDDDELPRGKDVMSELLKAIKESKILIVVFSKPMLLLNGVSMSS